MTPLRQRMRDHMQVRNLSPHTQRAYIENVAPFARTSGVRRRTWHPVLSPHRVHEFLTGTRSTPAHMDRTRRQSPPDSGPRLAYAAARLSPDQRRIALEIGDSGSDIWIWNFSGETGRWIAYESDESGRLEIFVRPWPSVDSGRWQVSAGGGRHAAWSAGGRELFYIDGTGRLVRVPVRNSGAFEPGPVSMVVASAFYVGLNR